MNEQILDSSLNEQRAGEPQSLLENVELMRLAWQSLEGKWGLAIGVTFVYMILVTGIQYIPPYLYAPYFKIGNIFSLIIAGPMALGFMTFLLALSRNKNAEFSQIF